MSADDSICGFHCALQNRACNAAPTSLAHRDRPRRTQPNRIARWSSKIVPRLVILPLSSDQQPAPPFTRYAVTRAAPRFQVMKQLLAPSVPLVT
jgi:hypothetical protein